MESKISENVYTTKELTQLSQRLKKHNEELGLFVLSDFPMFVLGTQDKFKSYIKYLSSGEKTFNFYFFIYEASLEELPLYAFNKAYSEIDRELIAWRLWLGR